MNRPPRVHSGTLIVAEPLLSGSGPPFPGQTGPSRNLESR
jgi:hypothetical protein